MQEVKFKGEEEQTVADPYVAYVPQMVKMITQGPAKPCLCDNVESYIYKVNDISMRVFVKMVEETGAWEVETPLAMCRYVKPEGDLLFNMQACQDCTVENARRRLHNKFLVDVFRVFMPRYDCGASANLMTEPNPPPDFTMERLDKIKELKKDKVGTTRKAIEYLALHGVYCGRDYQFDDAFDKASDVCFEKTIEEKQKIGKIRVRVEGRKPCWWNGKNKLDESGCRVKWAKGDGHTFLTPDVRVVKDDSPIEEDYTNSSLICAPEITESEKNPFEKIFASKNVLSIESSSDKPVEAQANPMYTIEEVDD